MKLVEVRVTQAHRGLAVGEIVRIKEPLAAGMVLQGRAELVGAPAPMGDPAVVSAGTDEPEPAPQEVAVEFTPAAPLDEAVAKPRKRTAKKVAEPEAEDDKPKPKRVRKGSYRRRDMRSKP